VNRRWAALLLLAAAALPAAAEEYPVPREPNQIFFVQRSLNSNTIVYTANLDGDGRLDPKQPVDVYWRRYNDEGERKELSGLERSMAFGVKTDPVPGKPGSYMVRVVSYAKRPALLRVVDGVPRLEMKVAGVPARLDHAYLDVDDSGSVPSVNRVDLYGYALATGKPLKESLLMSRTRKARKPISHDTGVAGVSTRVMSMPTVSSQTMAEGSSPPRARAARPQSRQPSASSAAATAHCSAHGSRATRG